MKLYDVLFVKSYFDENYQNVPDWADPEFPPIDNEGFIATLRNVANEKSPYKWYLIADEDIVTKNFMPSDRNAITVIFDESVFNINRLYEFNYVFIRDEKLDTYVYFVTGLKFNNALSQVSVTFDLKRDLWTTYYEEISALNYYFKTNRSHERIYRPLDNDTGRVELTFKQNIVDKPVKTKTIPSTNPARVLWAIYKLDPSIQYYNYIDDDTRYTLAEGDLGIAKYGVYYYLFRPICIVESDASISFNFRGSGIKTADTTHILSIEATFNPPFNYTLSYSADEVYTISGDFETMTIQYAAGQSYVTLGNFWVCRTPTYEYTYTYEGLSNYTKLSDRPFKDITAPDNSNWVASPYFGVYPYRYYTLRTPDGNYSQLKFDVPISSIQVWVNPTDTGGMFSYEVKDVAGNVLIPRTSTFKTYERSAQIPITPDALLSFLERSGNQNLVQYEYQLERVKDEKRDVYYEASQAVVQDVQAKSKEAALVLAAYTTGLPVQAAGAVSLGLNEESNYDYVGAMFTLDKLSDKEQFIKDNRAAMFEDLSNTTIMSAKANDVLCDLRFEDRFCLFVNTFIALDEYKTDFYEFVTKGVKNFNVRNPFLNNHLRYDYIECMNVNFKAIANPYHRYVINTILMNGTRKFHIDYLYDWSLNLFQENPQM